MKVILLQDVKNIGKKNQVVEVSDGYGQNYLIPRRLAVKSTEKGLEVRDRQIQQEKDEYLRKQQEARLLSEKINSLVLEFEAPSSKDGRMMGTISQKQVVELLKEKYGIAVDKRKFQDKYPINAFGYTNLKIELFKDVYATIKVHVSEKK
ncbi:MAG: 50S ribosomal protein L9 [Bacilli bacterium]|nr:50S ribosomal protein L9 [Bacillales bacterium]MDY2575539.1 50S ribosomal protein L9 [Bacilli bacterium]